jgi:hypothetical protein
MDILEANSQAMAMTPHRCKVNTCDKGRCGYNPYASEQKNFWGRQDGRHEQGVHRCDTIRSQRGEAVTDNAQVHSEWASNQRRRDDFELWLRRLDGWYDRYGTGSEDWE